MARSKRSDRNRVDSPVSQQFVVQDMVPTQLEVETGTGMLTLRELRDLIQEHWNVPHWMQRISTYQNGTLTEWGDAPHSTPISRLLEGQGPDTKVVSLNIPSEHDYIDIANTDEPFEIVMRDDQTAYMELRRRHRKPVQLISFADYKRIANDAVEQYDTFNEGARESPNEERATQRRRRT